MKKTALQVAPFFYFFISLLSCLLMIFPNSDLTIGRWALQIDEQILFDQLKKIYHFDSKEQLIRFFYDGGWPSYGPIFFNINAIVCILPKIFFGDPGIIFTGRMSGVFFIIISLILLTMTFLKNWALRAFCFLVLINIPGINYFMCNPKPEPIQLFFLSLFFYFFKKNKFCLSKSYWIFLGISFGAKISALPFLILVPTCAIYFVSFDQSLNDAMEHIPKTIFFILLGLIISVPFLFTNYILCLMIFVFIKYVLLGNKKEDSFLDVILIFGIISFNILIIAILHNFFHFHSEASSWFLNTFLSTKHPADHNSINFFSWVNYFFTTWLGSSIFFNLLFLITSFFIVVKGVKDFFKNNQLDKSNYIALVILSSGLFSIIILFAKVSRLWSFYLTPWIICIIIGVFSLLEMEYENNNPKSKIVNHIILKRILFITFIFSTVGITKNWITNNYMYYKDFSSRTKSENFKKNKQSYLTIIDFLEEQYDDKGYPITVAYDSFLPIPDKNYKFYTHRFFEPFEKWDTGYEAIILSERILKRVQQKPDSEAYEYNELQNEKTGYEKYVLNNVKECIHKQCYKKHKDLENGGVILLRTY